MSFIFLSNAELREYPIAIQNALKALFNEEMLDVSSFRWLSVYMAQGLGADTPIVESLLHSIPFSFKPAANMEKVDVLKTLEALFLAFAMYALDDLKIVPVFMVLDNNSPDHVITLSFPDQDTEKILIIVNSNKLKIIATQHSVPLLQSEFGWDSATGQFKLEIWDQPHLARLLAKVRIDLRTSRFTIFRAMSNFCDEVRSRLAFGIPPCIACDSEARNRVMCRCYGVAYCSDECKRVSFPGHLVECEKRLTQFWLAHQAHLQNLANQNGEELPQQLP